MNSRAKPSDKFKALMADPDRRDKFLPPMTQQEVAGVEKLLDPAVEEAERWCARFEILPSQLILPTALATIAELHNATPDAVAIRVVETLWITAFDDVFDSNPPSEPDVLRLLRESSAICLGSAAHTDAADPYIESLGAIRDTLVSFPSWSAVSPYWITSLIRLIDGMFFEYSLASSFGSGTPRLSLDAYLHYATYTLGFPHLMMTSLILQDCPLTVASIAALARLAEQCGLVMRLANDLATFPREAVDMNLNAIALIGPPGANQSHTMPSSDPLKETAKAKVRRMIHEESAQAYKMRAGIQTQEHVEQQFVRAMEFGVAMYSIGDFRTWTGTLAQTVSRHA